jgi:nucleotide-binding universal stress UspA family protein
MLKIARILAPTDLSELSREGVRTALEIGEFQGAEVTIYHVIEAEEATRYGETFPDEFSTYRGVGLNNDLISERKKLLAAFIRENFTDLVGDVKITQDVEVGAPYRKIIDRASKEGSDLIVMSTHGRTGLLYGLIGSVAEMVVRLASCPVLSVHPTRQRHEVRTQAA